MPKGGQKRLEKNTKDRCQVFHDVAAQVVKTKPVPDTFRLEDRDNGLVHIGEVDSVGVGREDRQKVVDGPFVILRV